MKKKPKIGDLIYQRSTGRFGIIMPSLDYNKAKVYIMWMEEEALRPGADYNIDSDFILGVWEQAEALKEESPGRAWASPII